MTSVTSTEIYLSSMKKSSVGNDDFKYIGIIIQTQILMILATVNKKPGPTLRLKISNNCCN